MTYDDGASGAVSRRRAVRSLAGAVAVAGGAAVLSACGAAGATNGTSGTKSASSSGTAGAAGGTAGSFTVNAATASKNWFTVKGTQLAVWDRGNDCWGTADTCTYLNQKASGAGKWSVQVVNLDSTNTWAKAGIMARSSLDGSAADVFLAVTVNNGIVLQNRETVGENEGSGPGGDNYSLETNANGGVAPAYLQLQVDASGNWTGWNSTDGKTWQNMTPSQANPVSLGSTYYIGLGATAHDNTKQGVATFTDLTGFKSTTFSADLVGTNDTTTPPTAPPTPGA
jgi:hypothetical protein